MNEQLISSVEDLGLSQKEARVYVANLTIGPASVQKIAEAAGIKRVTTYVILESLVNLGLVSQSTKAKKTLFTAEDPISLKRLLTKKEQDLADQKSNFEEILPDLHALKTLPTDSPEVKFYDSPDGIRSIIASFFASHKGEVADVYGISNLDQLHAFFPEMKRSLANPERVRQNIKSHFIYTSSDGPIYKSTDRERNRESRYMPPDKFSMSGDINIIGNNIIMLSLSGSKPIGITIHSQELAKGMRAMFEKVWEAAEQYNR